MQYLQLLDKFECQMDTNASQNCNANPTQTSFCKWEGSDFLETIQFLTVLWLDLAWGVLLSLPKQLRKCQTTTEHLAGCC